MKTPIEETLKDDYEALCRDAKIPSAGAVYWRASIRARAEAARKVDQPLTVAAGVATAATVGAGVAVVSVAWRMLPSQWTQWSVVHPLVANPVMTLAIAAAALIVVSPLALAALGSRMRFGRPQD